MEDPTTITIQGIVLPAEKSAAEAAEILDVSKHTIIRYCQQGILRWRDKTPWGRITYTISLESIYKLRTTYRSDPLYESQPARKRKRYSASKPSAHLTLRR